MTTLTVWLLIFAGASQRPAIVVGQFPDEATCQSAADQTTKKAMFAQYPFCIKAEIRK